MPENLSHAEELLNSTAACRLRWHWWGTHKALRPHQRVRAAQTFNADSNVISAGKHLVKSKDDEALQNLAALRGEVTDYWRNNTLPYVEDGVRLIRRDFVSGFDFVMQGHRNRLQLLASRLQERMDEVKYRARQRLGDLFNDADYPTDVAAQFSVEWDFPPVRPPEYLMNLNPELYEREAQAVRARFEHAVHLAEGAFAEELANLVQHLSERLEPGADGSRKVFRDSAVENLKEFFGRFRTLNINSSAELDRLVGQAESLIDGVNAKDLRTMPVLREQIQRGIGEVAQRLDALVTTPRRRQWTRNESPKPEPQEVA